MTWPILPNGGLLHRMTGKDSIASLEACKDKLTALRLRWLEESRRVIEYLDQKKVQEGDMILEGVRELWIER